MLIPKKIINFLDKKGIKYERICHRKVFTVHDKAATLRVKPNIIGKTLILKIDNELVMALVPGNKNLDKNKFKKSVNLYRKKQKLKPVKNLNFISERLMKSKFRGVKIGAVPPFGNLWGVPIFVDKSLLNLTKIIVNGGDYNWSIKITPPVLKKLTPDLITGSFSKSKG